MAKPRAQFRDRYAIFHFGTSIAKSDIATRGAGCSWVESMPRNNSEGEATHLPAIAWNALHVAPCRSFCFISVQAHLPRGPRNAILAVPFSPSQSDDALRSCERRSRRPNVPAL